MKDKNSRKHKHTFTGGPITFFDNLRRYSEYESGAVCGICKQETGGLMQCRECSFVFCPSCMLKLYNISGPMAEAFAQCPDCTGTNLSDIIF